MTRLRCCFVVFCSLLLTAGAVAQIQNGQITGTVTDPSGAAVPNAKIAIINQATNLSVTTNSGPTGLYNAKELPVGSYKITVEASGFKTFTDSNVRLDVGAITHVDVKMTLGEAREVVEVTGQEAVVNTEDSRLTSTIGSAQISNLPLNGRNVFDLMQLSAGAVNVAGVDFENGHNTVVNGVREDFNGFLINGVSNKGLSGGVVNVPIQDTVEEFQQLGLNMSAQYGNSAGSTVNLVTKSGTNQLHGSVWEYLRNDAANANDFFLNQQGVKRPALRWNQFGFTLGGPIVKDKLFFFGSYQGSRFTTVGTPSPVVVESQDWRNAIALADTNSGVQSVAGALYSKFTPSVAGTPLNTVDAYVTGGLSSSGFTSYVDYLCPDSYFTLGGGTGNATKAQVNAIAARMQSIFGVLPSDDFTKVPILGGKPCSTTPGSQLGTVGRTMLGSSMVMQNTSVALFKSQTGSGINQNLFNGNESTLRLDYNWNTNNRLSVNYNDARTTDGFGPCASSCMRGFTNPIKGRTPNGQFSFVHTFSPAVLNDFRAGYTQNVSLINTSQGGVPSTSFDDGSVGFGSYSGYPQFFKENIYTYSDMVSITHGNHNMKIGGDVRRNIENSEFNVARPSYYFNDPFFFAADAPYSVSAGVNPGICAPPCSQSTIQQLVSSNATPNANLESNVRHWRNIEFGAYFQDDWKVSKRLTLQLGMRYDLYRRHNEENNKATTFDLGPGPGPIFGVINANAPAGSPGCNTNAAQMAMAQLAGVCGPGGFAASSTLGKGRHKDFGPRVGFAWDVFGNGKTSLRGGFGLAYEGTLYNPLSNSRWNLPYYSFNSVTGWVGGDVNGIVYGPTSCAGASFPNNCVPVGGAQFGSGGVAPTFVGPPSGTQGQGTVGSQAQGNIDGWNPLNPNLASLTGIIFPQGIDDPYVYNYYFGVQHEILPKTVLEVDFVGTTGHKLFRAEDVNRLPGTLLPAGSTLVNNIGETVTGFGGRPNPNYGRLRVWENSVNSNYNSLQASVRRQMSHGLLFNVNYTYSHSIDNGSTWHSGSTTANGAAGGEGFTTDPTHPQFDRGNSIYDIRQRLVINHVWQLPGQNLKSVGGVLLGGWSLNGVWQFQSGAHWQPFRSSAARLTEITILDPVNNPNGVCTVADIPSNCVNKGGDYLLTRGRNERPDSSVAGFSDFSRSTWALGWKKGGQTNLPVLSAPCLACLGNLGRNTFVGPGLWQTDMSLAKIFRLTERFNLKFDASAFNLFNRTNFELATGGTTNKNNIASGNFGVAGGVIGQRTMQFGLKLSF
jgi:Carboxypeptidase regulatory-like domain/TonB dependent receptor